MPLPLSTHRRAAIKREMADLWAVFAPHALDADGDPVRLDAAFARPGVRLAWQRWHRLNGRILRDRLPWSEAA